MSQPTSPTPEGSQPGSPCIVYDPFDPKFLPIFERFPPHIQASAIDAMIQGIERCRRPPTEDDRRAALEKVKPEDLDYWWARIRKNREETIVKISWHVAMLLRVRLFPSTCHV